MESLQTLLSCVEAAKVSRSVQHSQLQIGNPERTLPPHTHTHTHTHGTSVMFSVILIKMSGTVARPHCLAIAAVTMETAIT